MTNLLVIILLIDLIILVLSQLNYKYDFLNNSIELKLIDSKNHFLAANISSYNLGDIIHIFIKIPTGGEDDSFKKENIKFFTLTEDYTNLENITIPDKLENITIKLEKNNFFYINYYIDYEITNENMKHLILLIHDKIEDIYGYAIITDLDESKRIELNIKDNSNYNFENNPLLIIFNMKEYNFAHFKFNSKINILENYVIKYTHFLHSMNEFTSFQEKNFIEIKKEQCYSIKNGDNNYTIYFNFIYNNCCTSYAFIIKAIKKEDLLIESLYYSFMQTIYINNFNEERMVNSITNNLGIGIVSAKPLTGKYIFFVIYQKYNKQRLSNNIDFYYSFSNNNYTFEQKEFNLNILKYKHKELENLDNLYYCQTYLNNYDSIRLFLYFLGGGGLFIRIGYLYEWIIPLKLYSKYSYIFNRHEHYSIGFGDLIENEIYYFKIIVNNSEKVNFNYFLTNQTINNLTEVKDPINIDLKYFSFGIDNEQIYYFNLINNDNNSVLILDILSNIDTNITIENTKTNENASEYYNLEKYEAKTILFHSKNLFLTLNISNFKNEEIIYMKFEALLSSFNISKIYYTMDFDQYNIKYLTSEKCINNINNSKLSIYCNYTKQDNNIIQFFVLLNPNNSIIIQNCKNFENIEPKDSEGENSNYLKIIIILIIVIFLIITIFSIVLIIITIKKKKNKKNNLDEESKSNNFIEKELNDGFSLNN